jgi:hypothetical protein
MFESLAALQSRKAAPGEPGRGGEMREGMDAVLEQGPGRKGGMDAEGGYRMLAAMSTSGLLGLGQQQSQQTRL